MDPLDPSVTEALRAWKTQYEAGVAMPENLELCASLCTSPSAKVGFLNASQASVRGADMRDVLKALDGVLPPAERGALSTGFKYGRFEHTLGALIEHRELWYRTRQRIRAKMILPAGTLLIASFVGPLPMLVTTGNVLLYIAMAGTPITVALVAWICFSQAMRARVMRPTAGEPPGALDTWLLKVPVVKGVERNRNLAEFAGLTAPLIGSGATLVDTIQLCSEVLPNGYYRADLAGCAQVMRGGNPLHSTLKTGERWPPEFVAAIAVGEKTGALEETMQRQAVELRARYSMAIELLADWLPKIAYAIMALFIIVNIFMIFMGYVGMVMDLSSTT
jgi:type IV pilus assembly protein PilC